MPNSVSIDRVLCLPEIDIAALLRGYTVAVLPGVSIPQGWEFMLYPQSNLELGLDPVKNYRPYILSGSTQTSSSSEQTVGIEAWARCDHSIVIQDSEQLNILSKLAIWTEERLQSLFESLGHLHISFLRTYRLPRSVTVPKQLLGVKKSGRFVSLASLCEGYQEAGRIQIVLPVLSDLAFEKRKNRLENLKPPLHPELEELHHSIAQLIPTNPNLSTLEKDLRHFLELHIANHSTSKELSPELSWIRKISEVGNSSDGHLFEKLCRKALLFLGFQGDGIDPEGMGGAGGMDLHCEFPYPLVGECKATKTEKVKDEAPAQLLKIGMNHLGKEFYESCVKLLIVAGSWTNFAERTAREHEMNAIRPETLQALVELQARHHGSVDLIELKNCLKKAPFGTSADDKVRELISSIRDRLRVRSQLVETVKLLTEPEKTQLEVTEIRVYYNAVFCNDKCLKLDNPTTHEILIELSSPLSGHLGRVQGGSLNSDRFYFLRDLPVDDITN